MVTSLKGRFGNRTSVEVRRMGQVTGILEVCQMGRKDYQVREHPRVSEEEVPSGGCGGDADGRLGCDGYGLCQSEMSDGLYQSEMSDRRMTG